MFIEADWGEKYQRLIDRGQLGQLAKEMVKDGYHPDEIEKIIKVIDGPIGGSYTIKGRPEREANWHMASGECPDCGHSMKKHTRGGGCMNTKPGSSGKPVSCGCGRTAMNKQAARWIELEARKFMADNEDAFSDLHELRTRAANFAALKTSTLPVDQHRAIVAGFVARVNDLGRRVPKRTAARKVAAVNDFPDALMFID
jgi:hypothetical protein